MYSIDVPTVKYQWFMNRYQIGVCVYALVFIVLIHSMNAAIARDHVVKMIKRDCMEQPGNSSD